MIESDTPPGYAIHDPKDYLVGQHSVMTAVLEC